MAELSALHVKISGDASGLEAELQDLVAKIKATGAQVANLGSAQDKAAGASSKFAQQSRMLSMQLSQVGQQAMAGGGFLRALAIQLPDIGLAFGALGTAVGLVAGIALPMLASALGNSTDEAKSAEDQAAALKEAFSSLDSIARATGAGVDAYLNSAFRGSSEAMRALIADLKELRMQTIFETLRDQMDATTAAVDKLAAGVVAFTVTGNKGLELMIEQSGMTTDEIVNLKNALDRIETATSQEELARYLAAARDYAASLGNETADAVVAGLTAMANEAGVLEQILKAAAGHVDAMVANFDALDPFGGAGDFIPGSGLSWEEQGRAGRRSGGSRTATTNLSRELEAVRRAVATETELLQQTYDQQLEVLRAALAAKLIEADEYYALAEAAAQEHADALARINTGYHGSALDMAGTFFGDMASAFSQGNEKMLRIAKVFGAAEALINAFRAFNQVLADPTLPWFAKIAAAAGVMGAGMGMVAAIRGVSKGGGGGHGAGTIGAGGAAITHQSASVSRNVAIHLRGGDMYSRDQVIQLINGINEAVEDGAVIRLV